MKISLRAKLVALILLVLFIAVGLLYYQSLNFFRRDKETYVYDFISQVANSQANQLDRKLEAQKRLLELFHDFSSYKLSVTERERFLKKYQSFDYVGSFVYRQGRLRDDLVIADRARLQSVGLTASKVKTNKTILELLRSDSPFQVVNVTSQSSNPVVALVFRPTVNRVVLGVLPQRNLIDFSSDKKAFAAYVVNARGELLMHPSAFELLKREPKGGHPLVKAWMANPKLSQTKEFTSGGEPLLGAYANIPSANFGLFVETPKEQALLAAKRLVKATSVWAAIAFLACCVLGILFAYSITKPLKELARLTRNIAKGDFSVQSKIRSNDEIGELVTSFNTMSQELKVREQRIEDQHRQLVQSEKMGAFGQMSAGIAHEVKNPLAGILGYAQLSKRKIDESSPLRKYLDIIEKETKRCKEIIENLMKFARQEESIFEPIEINQAVRDAIALVDHQITINGIKLQSDIAEDGAMPKIVGNANQLQQVLTNLMLNAQHAMDDGGVLTVRTSSNGDQHAYIEIEDTGHGIKQENLEKIFEPFFTTKEAGKGTGLGLAVSYGIIRDHKGDIKVASEVGKGTKFTIKLPNADSPSAPASGSTKEA